MSQHREHPPARFLQHLFRPHFIPGVDSSQIAPCLAEVRAIQLRDFRGRQIEVMGAAVKAWNKKNRERKNAYTADALQGILCGRFSVLQRGASAIKGGGIK